MATVSACQVTFFFFGRLWVWREGRWVPPPQGFGRHCGSGKLSMEEWGRCCNNPTVSPHQHTQGCPLRLHAQASQAGSGSQPSSPLDIRLRLAFSGSSAGSSTVVSVWVLSPDSLRFLSSRRVGLCGMSTTPWGSVGGSLAGGLSKKYFSTGRSLSSGASKSSCLFPVLYSPVGTDKNTEIKIQVLTWRQVMGG